MALPVPNPDNSWWRHHNFVICNQMDPKLESTFSTTFWDKVEEKEEDGCEIHVVHYQTSQNKKSSF